ncbi:hypothetical protein BGW80DRAFT_1567991 [Lactifluus volemus]|nr:hypothetical protein BGW80DRAFT_1567991 [Lactifluus volemus]
MGSNIVVRQREESLIQQEPRQEFRRVTIGSLPDNVLLEIFDFYQIVINEKVINTKEVDEHHPWNWEKLVHVCRRWRYIIFESPVRLNLQLFCTKDSPVRKLLDVWPLFPLVIRYSYSSWGWEGPEDCINSTNNLVAALERRDRVREIQVYVFNAPDHVCDQIVTAMEKPFPALRSLTLGSVNGILPELDTLSNGSAPCLRELTLWGISFPSLPQLLSSTSDLTSLNLYNIPNSGYVSPETMATSLSALPKLECLVVKFGSPIPHPERRNRAPTRFILPFLTKLELEGLSEYLEVLAARFDASLLDKFLITFAHQPQVDFDIPQTGRLFCSCLDSFKPLGLDITLTFRWQDCASIGVSFTSIATADSEFSPSHLWKIMCEDLDHQVISVAQICGQIPSFRSSVKSLIIHCQNLDDLNRTLWLQLFRLFPSVQFLHIPFLLQQSIESGSERSGEESLTVVDELFPSLRGIVHYGPYR